ncbi:CsiV family protein [Pseudoalteromonas rubra]|uniref:CsiV family protein n=1 Tax=Pseudoalteromonas rubra TaxID=43658 RepID=UPI000F76AA04|nr:CsiV family protein [Pseudoalteromonas rubra]
MIRTALSLTILSTAMLASAPASAKRWFEVELIAFAQKDNEQLREDFTIENPELDLNRTLDLLTKGYNSAGQQACLNGDSRFDTRPVTSRFVQQDASWHCGDGADYMEKFQQLPLTPYAEPQEHMQSIYLLNEEQLRFDKVLNQLKRKGLEPILHTGWRFPEQSKKRAPNILVYGGQKFEQPASYVARLDAPDNGFISLLGQPEPRAVKEQDPAQWELQGWMKIHVRHYLYVTSNFDYHYKSDEGDLESARMSQFTRVYSGDIHYLDHPKMGIIFQIRKYRH